MIEFLILSIITPKFNKSLTHREIDRFTDFLISTNYDCKSLTPREIDRFTDFLISTNYDCKSLTPREIDSRKDIITLRYRSH